MSLPLTIVGGYLGSGKTTLLNHMLRHADGLRLAVLVNEFGDLPIDADLIEAEDGNMISIAGGCVCCSFGDDLSKALSDLAALDPAPDHVLLETSGVALPGAIAASLLFAPGYSHDGTVVLANAETIQTQAGDTYVGDTVQRQLLDADLIILNKVDLVSDETQGAVKGWLEGSFPKAQIVSATNGVLPMAVLMQSFLGRETKAALAHIHQADIFETKVLDFDRPVDVEKLAAVLASENLGLFRAKGFVRDQSGALMTVQVVGRRWLVSIASKQVAVGLVVIGERAKMEQAVLDQALSEFR